MKKLLYIFAFICLLPFAVQAEVITYNTGTSSGVTAVTPQPGIWVTTGSTGGTGGTSTFVTFSDENLFAFVIPEQVDVHRDDGSFRTEHHCDGNAASDPCRNESGVTTGWTDANGIEFVNETTNVSTGSNAFKVVAQGTDGGSIYKDLSSLFSNNDAVTISVDYRHTGSDGVWQLSLNDDQSVTTPTDSVSVSNTDTTYQTWGTSFIYSSEYRFLVFGENSGTNDGGVYIDNISITSPDIAVNRGLGSMSVTSTGGATTYSVDATTGLLIHRAANEPSIECFGKVCGFSLHSGHTIYNLWNTDLSNVVWTKTRSFVTGMGTDPTGGEGAFFLAADGSDNSHFIEQGFALAVFTDNESVTYATYIQASTLNWVRLYLKTKDGSNLHAYFNVSTGVVGAASGLSSYGISKNKYNGAYRIWITASIESAATLPLVRLYLADADNSSSFQSDGSGVTVFWPTVTEQASAMPPGPTEGSAYVNAGNAGGILYALPNAGVTVETAPGLNVFEEVLGTVIADDDMADDDTGDWNATEVAALLFDTDHYTVSTVSSGQRIYLPDPPLELFNTTTLYKVSVDIADGTASSKDVALYFSDGVTAQYSAAFTTSGTTTTISAYFRSPIDTGAGRTGLRIVDDLAGAFINILNFSTKPVTSAFDPTSGVSGLMPNNGTWLGAVRFGYNYDEDTSGANRGLVNVASAGTGLLYNNAAGPGSIRSFDQATTLNVTLSWIAHRWYWFVVEWAFLDNNVSEFRVCYVDNGLTCGTDGSFDGAFATATQLLLGYGVFAEAWIGPMFLFRGHKSDDFYQFEGG